MLKNAGFLEQQYKKVISCQLVFTVNEGTSNSESCAINLRSAFSVNCQRFPLRQYHARRLIVNLLAEAAPSRHRQMKPVHILEVDGQSTLPSFVRSVEESSVRLLAGQFNQEQLACWKLKLLRRLELPECRCQLLVTYQSFILTWTTASARASANQRGHVLPVCRRHPVSSFRRFVIVVLMTGSSQPFMKKFLLLSLQLISVRQNISCASLLLVYLFWNSTWFTTTTRRCNWSIQTNTTAHLPLQWKRVGGIPACRRTFLWFGTMGVQKIFPGVKVIEGGDGLGIHRLVTVYQLGCQECVLPENIFELG